MSSPSSSSVVSRSRFTPAAAITAAPVAATVAVAGASVLRPFSLLSPPLPLPLPAEEGESLDCIVAEEDGEGDEDGDEDGECVVGCCCCDRRSECGEVAGDGAVETSVEDATLDSARGADRSDTAASMEQRQ